MVKTVEFRNVYDLIPFDAHKIFNTKNYIPLTNRLGKAITRTSIAIFALLDYSQCFVSGRNNIDFII